MPPATPSPESQNEFHAPVGNTGINLGVLLLLVFVATFAGAAGFFAGKSTSSSVLQGLDQEVQAPRLSDDQIQHLANIQAEAAAKPKITLISPATFGEYKVGGEMAVSWRSENAPEGSKVKVYLLSDTDEESFQTHTSVYEGPPTSELTWKIPRTYCMYGKCDTLILAGVYKIVARLVPPNFCEKNLFDRDSFCSAQTTDQHLSVARSPNLDFRTDAFVELFAGYANTSSEEGMIAVPRGTKLSLWWKSSGAQSCTISPSLPGYGDTNVGTNGNARTGSLEKNTTFKITCPLKESGVVSDTLDVHLE